MAARRGQGSGGAPVQSEPSWHALVCEPGPPSSQLPSAAKRQVSVHTRVTPFLHATPARWPQSSQSVPKVHVLHFEPGPPSSQLPSRLSTQLSSHESEPTSASRRSPQSVQSVPSGHCALSDPGPLSSHSPSRE